MARARPSWLPWTRGVLQDEGLDELLEATVCLQDVLEGAHAPVDTAPHISAKVGKEALLLSKARAKRLCLLTVRSEGLANRKSPHEGRDDWYIYVMRFVN